MSVFSPPKSHYTNYYEQQKFRLVWNLCVLISILFVFLAVFHTITSDPNAITAGLGAILAVCVLLILKVRGTFKFAATMAFIVATLVIQGDIFVLVNPNKGVDLCWIIAAGLFMYHILGNSYGSTFMAINMTGFLLAIYFTSKGYLQPIFESAGSDNLMNITFNIATAVIVISYLISKILRDSKIAEQSYNQANILLKEQNETVRAQNEEKTILLKEIHHRVKNNLQVITSLLRLQSSEIKDADSINHFRETTNRVMAMALIHDRLYQSEDFSRIDLQQYLKSLSDDLIRSYSIELPVSVTVKSEVENVNPKSIVSVALLFNELISNSLKHGFESVDEGEIVIDVKETFDVNKAPQIEMWYQDNGIWKAPTKDSSFGQDLIETLTQQMDGVYELNTDSGTKYHFTFRLEN